MQKTAIAGLFAALLLTIPAMAHAQSVGMLDSLVATFQNNAAALGASILLAAQGLFALLAGIEIVLVVGFALPNKPDWSDLMWLIARNLITLGFFYWVMMNWSVFALAIVKGFGMIANNATIAAGGTQNLSPSDIVSSGMNMVHAVWQGMTWKEPVLAALLMIAGLIIAWVYAKVTGLMIEVLIESLIVAYAGIILLGFGGLKQGRGYAESQIRFAISVGVKRMVLQLVIGMAETMMSGWSAQISAGKMNTSWDSIFLMITVPLVFLQLAEKLPYRAQDMVNGSVTQGSGSLLQKAAAMGAAAGAAAAAVAGAAAATQAAFQMAQAQLASAGGEGGGGDPAGMGGEGNGGGGGGSGGGLSGKIMRGAQLVGKTASNVSNAASADVGRRMTGNYGSRSGVAGMRMAARMNKERRAMSEGE